MKSLRHLASSRRSPAHAAHDRPAKMTKLLLALFAAYLVMEKPGEFNKPEFYPDNPHSSTLKCVLFISKAKKTHIISPKQVCARGAVGVQPRPPSFSPCTHHALAGACAGRHLRRAIHDRFAPPRVPAGLIPAHSRATSTIARCSAFLNSQDTTTSTRTRTPSHPSSECIQSHWVLFLLLAPRRYYTRVLADPGARLTPVRPAPRLSNVARTRRCPAQAPCLLSSFPPPRARPSTGLAWEAPPPR